MFDSSAILLYLGDKVGRFIGNPKDRPELLSWLFFIASGLGPFSGQAVHFQFAAPEGLDYARNRYRREAERHNKVLDDHLMGHSFIIGDTYTIADMSAWGWIDRASRVLKGQDNPLDAYTEQVARDRVGYRAHPSDGRSCSAIWVCDRRLEF